MNFLTELKEGLGISWAAIRANKMRSILTTLGIVIGIVTVTLMGTAIEGLNRAFINSISFIGADVLYVERFDWFNDTREGWMRMQKRRRERHPNLLIDVCTPTELVCVCQRLSAAVSGSILHCASTSESRLSGEFR